MSEPVPDTASPDAQKWLRRMDAGLLFRKKTKATLRWNSIVDYYENEFGQAEGIISPTYNMVYMFGRALVPNIVFQAPQIMNTARRPEFIPWAQTLDAIDNWLVQEMEVEDMFKKAVQYAYLFNIAPMKLGWDYPDGSDGEEGPIQTKLSLAMGFAKMKGVVNRARRQNFPYLDLVDPRKILFAPYTRDIRTCRWYAQVVKAYTEDLKKLLGRDDLEGTHVPSQDYFSNQDSMNADMLEADADGRCQEYTLFYEIHDAVSGQMCWLDVNGVFLKPWQKDPLQMDGLNLETIIFNPTPFSIWGVPDALYIEGQMLDGNDTRIMGMRQRRISLVKGFIDEQLLSSEEAEKMYSNEALPLIRIKPNGTKSLSEALLLVQPHVQQEYLQYQSGLKQDAQDILGFGSNQLGNLASGRRTRFEVQVVNDNSQARLNERREMTARAITGIMRKANQLVIKNWKKPYVVRVIGADLAQYWVEVNPSELTEKALADELSTSVNVASMSPSSYDRVKQEASELLAVVGKIPGLNVLPIVRELLSKFSWLDISAVLPQAAQDSNLSMAQFSRVQQQLAASDSDAGEQRLRSSQAANLQTSVPALLSKLNMSQQSKPQS